MVVYLRDTLLRVDLGQNPVCNAKLGTIGRNKAAAQLVSSADHRQN